MNKAVRILTTVRGIALAGLVGWAALRLGAVEAIDFYPVFMGLVLLFLLSLADGLRVKWWGWLLLAPLAPMAFNNSYPFELLQFAALWLAIVLAAHHTGREWQENSRIGLMIGLLLAVGLLQAVIGLAQCLGSLAEPIAGSPVSRMGNIMPMGTIYTRNHFSGFLEMLVPMAVAIGISALYRQNRRRECSFRERLQSSADGVAKAWLFVLAGALMFLAILFSLSRGGTLAAIGGTAAAVLILNRRRPRHDPALARATTWSMAVLVLAGALWIGVQPVIERFLLVSDGAEGRSGIWEGTIPMISGHLFSGVGAGMHGWAFAAHNPFQADAFFDYAHNDFLQAAAEWGLPAAVIFFGTVFFLIARSAKACLQAANPARTGALAGGVGGATALLLHSLMDFNFHIPANAILFGTILGSTYGIAAVREVELIGNGFQVSGSQVSESQVPGSRVSGLRVPGSRIPGSQVSESQVSGSQVSGSQVSGSRVPGSQVPGSQVSGSRIPGSQVRKSSEPGTRNIESPLP